MKLRLLHLEIIFLRALERIEGFRRVLLLLLIMESEDFEDDD